MPITITHKGNLSKTKLFLERCKNLFRLGVLDKYGREGVIALANATPIESGKTASMWRYEVHNLKNGIELVFYNDNVTKDGTPIAILLQYGHGTGTGGYVRGRDYINPAIRPIFDKITDALWKEVTR